MVVAPHPVVLESDASVCVRLCAGGGVEVAMIAPLLAAISELAEDVVASGAASVGESAAAAASLSGSGRCRLNPV
jgi:hypothetical protein